MNRQNILRYCFTIFRQLQQYSRLFVQKLLSKQKSRNTRQNAREPKLSVSASGSSLKIEENDESRSRS